MPRIPDGSIFKNVLPATTFAENLRVSPIFNIVSETQAAVGTVRKTSKMTIPQTTIKVGDTFKLIITQIQSLRCDPSGVQGIAAPTQIHLPFRIDI